MPPLKKDLPRKRPLSAIEQYVIDFVRRIRDEKGKTQLDIAEILEVTEAHISNIENPNYRSKYNLNDINRFAKLFGIHPNAFLPKEILPFEDKIKRVRKASSTPKKAAVTKQAVSERKEKGK